MGEFEGLVAFAILMENNEGILYKSPDYIREKYEFCMTMEQPRRLLDPQNQAKYDEWFNRWWEEYD